MSNWSDDLRRDPPIWVQIPVLPLIVTTVVTVEMWVKRAYRGLTCYPLSDSCKINILFGIQTVYWYIYHLYYNIYY